MTVDPGVDFREGYQWHHRSDMRASLGRALRLTRSAIAVEQGCKREPGYERPRVTSFWSGSRA